MTARNQNYKTPARSNRGTHPILIDQYPGICINCGAPETYHDAFPCPNRLLTPKDWRAFRAADKQNLKDNLSDLDNIMKKAGL